MSRVVGVAIAIGAVAFGLPSTATAQAAHIHDSAGIAIVDAASRAKAPVSLELSAKPVLDLGGLKDNPEDEFNSRGGYFTGIRLSDGSTVVADNAHLRFFDAKGVQTHVTGRDGAGPGEFRQISAICHTRGDTIVASDAGNSRAVVYDRNGTLLQTIPLARGTLLGCLDDGTWISEEYGSAPAYAETLVRYQLNGTSTGQVTAAVPAPFDMFIDTSPQFAAAVKFVYSGDPLTNQIDVHDANGRVVRIIRTTDPIQETTASERRDLRPRMAPASNNSKEVLDRFEARLRAAPRPGHWPAFRHISADPEGRLWIEAYPHSRNANQVWTGFAPDGRLLGKLSLPPDTGSARPTVLRFTARGVMIRREDDDGAVHLVEYALVPVRHR